MDYRKDKERAENGNYLTDMNGQNDIHEKQKHKLVLNYKPNGKTFSLSIWSDGEFRLYTERTPEAVEILKILQEIKTEILDKKE